MFPFNGGAGPVAEEDNTEKPFFISPINNKSAKAHMDKTISLDMHRELPMQFDIQAPQYAHRLIKDYQRTEAVKGA